MKKTNEYTANDVKVLDDIEHVRIRTAVYLGNMSPSTYSIPYFTSKQFEIRSTTFTPAVLKTLNEIIDNSWDELLQHNQKNKQLDIIGDPATGEYTVSDNGRGIPITMHSSGKYTPEVALSSLRAGRNFTNDKSAGVIGMNGVGASVTAMVSTQFNVVINRDGQQYTQEFRNGTRVIDAPKIVKSKIKETGTSVTFVLDKEVFKETALPYDLVRNRAIDLAISSPDLGVSFNGEDFKFKGGFEELLAKYSKAYYKFTSPIGEMYVVFDLYKGIDEQVFTWVNSSMLFDGGICNTQFMNAFIDKVIDHLLPAAKKRKCDVTKNDIRKDLLVFGVLRVANPEYDAQSKTRLTGPNMRKDMVDMVTEGWLGFSKKQKDWLEVVLERAADRHHQRADKDAMKDHQNKINKKIIGLLDATGKDRAKCRILICEGLSASSQISEVRDPTTTAAFSLTGKINNVYGCKVSEVLNMGKLTQLLAAIGLVPGRKAIRSSLNYGQIIVATDADVDGGNIFTLLVNLFYQYWPELFDPSLPPIVHRLTAPNVVASKGNKRIHFTNRIEFEANKSKYSGWTIEYMKGLGSMAKEDWEMILDGGSNMIIPLAEDGDIADTLTLLFGPDEELRKIWLQT